MKVFENKNVVITGGSDGIGLAIAEEFAKNGANILLVARDKIKLDSAIVQLSQYKIKTIGIAIDLSKSSELDTLVKEIENRFKTVDVLVNNAGFSQFIPFESTTEEIAYKHINLNIMAVYSLTQKLLPMLVETKGNVINISSYLASRMLSGRTTSMYSTTKGAVNSLTKSLAFELGPKGVRVNSIAPGSVSTSMLRNNLSKLPEEDILKFENMVKEIYPLGRIGEPQDIADAALFLASDKAKWITGITLPVDGGLTTN